MSNNLSSRCAASMVALVPAMLCAASAAAAGASAPLANIQAGAEAGPQVSTMLANVRPCTHYVRTDGNDTATGTSLSAAWKTLGAAVPRLRAGQTLCVAPGTYQEATARARATGSESDPIAVRPLPGAAKRPVIHATADSSLFDLQAGPGQQLGYWLIDGLVIDKQQRYDGASVRVEGDRASSTDTARVHHVVVRNNTIRNSKAGGAILVRNRVTDVLIVGNTITDHRRVEWWRNYRKPGAQRLRVDYADDVSIPSASGDDRYGRADAHGVSIEGDSTFLGISSVERVRIERNTLSRNGGDGVQCIGAADGNRQDHVSDPADIDLLDNRMEANVEDGVDIKSCQRVSIRGSVSPAQQTVAAANNKLLTSRPTNRARDLQLDSGNGNFGGGGLIVLHWNARHILVENSRLFDACGGISVGRAEVPVRDLVVRRVLIFNLRGKSTPECAAYGGGAGTGVRLDRVENADLYHNTFDLSATEGTGLVVGAALAPRADTAPPYLRNVGFVNNIVVARVLVKALLRANVTWTEGFHSDHNVLSSPSATPFWLRNGGPSLDAVNWATWRAAGLDVSSNVGSPLFVANPAAQDYFTQPSSPARDAAQPIPGYAVPTCPGSSAPNPPDIGFRESCTQ
jgi:hypothetical protein